MKTIKLTKTQVVLYMYEQLLTQKKLVSKEIKNKFNLQTKTFLRYISEIRIYLANTYSKEELCYFRSNQEYRIIEY